MLLTPNPRLSDASCFVFHMKTDNHNLLSAFPIGQTWFLTKITPTFCSRSVKYCLYLASMYTEVILVYTSTSVICPFQICAAMLKCLQVHVILIITCCFSVFISQFNLNTSPESSAKNYFFYFTNGEPGEEWDLVTH
jgi:hypothetical protein